MTYLIVNHIAAETDVTYDVLFRVEYPDVTICQSLQLIGGISENIRVKLAKINENVRGTDDQNFILCQQPDCSDMIMKLECPGTKLEMKIIGTA